MTKPLRNHRWQIMPWPVQVCFIVAWALVAIEYVLR